MSLQLIQQYHAEVERIVQYGGSRNEASIRSAFQRLLEHYCAGKGLTLIAELPYPTTSGTTVRPDGTVKDALRQAWGYWESKDQYDTLDDEIGKKFERGYPRTNIVFEDGQTAVLFQNGREVARTALSDDRALHALLSSFVSYEPADVRTFRDAIECFKADLPPLLVELRRLIEEQAERNAVFARKRAEFLELCQEAINPDLTLADVREMLIQHILTEDIFTSVFNEAQFHRENNIARELQTVVGTFFVGAVRRNIGERIAPYVNVIRAAASNIADHHEKQRFLKVVYENFYKAYNPAGADRLGIVYTPNEIVRFMIEGAEWLTERHWGRLLGDRNVEILDPATGTGTFVTELIEYLPKQDLPHKYQHEIHCNEVAILPYYIANLNIEYTYKQKMGTYAEFANICFVDTLDNLGFEFEGKQGSFLGLAAENLERIKRQNERTISVIIGNPPYNANQRNENENNKNREYTGVDKRIKATYIEQSTAQKTKLYDMYTRFWRWASDRLADDGVIAFVTNRSFIDARGFDGFRKVVANEFSEIYVVDLGGDVRQNPKLSGPKHNVFAIQTGVAICFMVKKRDTKKVPCRIYYARRPEMETAREKLQFLGATRLAAVPFTHIIPDRSNNWINQNETSWDDLLPVASKETKFAKRADKQQAIFKLFSLGVVTNRDEWVYADTEAQLKQKIQFFIDVYNRQVQQLPADVQRENVSDVLDYSIKWTRAVKNDLIKRKRYTYYSDGVVDALYRPFTKQKLYFRPELNEVQYQNPLIFPNKDAENIIIAIDVSDKPFGVLASKYLVDLHFNGDTQCLPLYRYDDLGNRLDNITGWAVEQFRAHYGDAAITPLDIFYYVYAVLHHPHYRATYEINLKREFPRIPFYADFGQWAAWGTQLMALHLDYETAEPFPLQRTDTPTAPNRVPARPRLKADKTAHSIEIDGETTLRGVPPQAWDYKLGNRSALEWVLERYKETTPKDPTIAARFNTYRFADYKEQVIDLLGRVCAVSVETMRIVGEMEQ